MNIYEPSPLLSASFFALTDGLERDSLVASHGDMPKRGRVTFLGDVDWVIQGNPDPEKAPDGAGGYG